MTSSGSLILYFFFPSETGIVSLPEADGHMKERGYRNKIRVVIGRKKGERAVDQTPTTFSCNPQGGCKLSALAKLNNSFIIL